MLDSIDSDVHRALSTDRRAHLECINEYGLPQGPLPESELVWNIASTKDSVSLPHIDSSGFGTVCQIESGPKLWAICHAKDRDLAASADAYSEPDYNNLGTSPKLFTMEWILLQPNEIL